MTRALVATVLAQIATVDQTTREALRAAAEELTRQCVWVETEGGEYWDTTCGAQLVWEDGPPSRHGAKFCSRCGGQMVERPYVEPTDDTEEPE